MTTIDDPERERARLRSVDPDALLDAWRSACHDVHEDYRYWCGSGRGSRSEAYGVFIAALDREAAAAVALQHTRATRR